MNEAKINAAIRVISRLEGINAELLAALKKAEPHVELLHSLLPKGESRSSVWTIIKQIRTAIAKAQP